MNEQAEIETGTALAIPAPSALATAFQKPEEMEGILARIEQEVRSHVADVTTAAGRKAIASLAYKVAQSKTALDAAGKDLTDEWRKATDAVNAERRKVRERLDALKVEARAPLDEWEAAEEARVAALKSRLSDIVNAAPDEETSDAIRNLVARIEGTAIDDSWQEYLPMAAKAKDATLAGLRAQLYAVEQREAEQAELARLRAEAAAREEEERRRAEEAERAERLKKRAANARLHIELAGEGRIGGEVQPFGILIYELERKIPPLIDELGEYAEDLHNLRLATLRQLHEAMERQQAAEAEKAEEARKAAAERAAQEAKEQAAREAAEREAEYKRIVAAEAAKAEAAAKAERDRIEAERRAEAEAQEKRERNKRIRNRVRKEIVETLTTLTGRAEDADVIADALMAGEIPHTKVTL